MPSLISVFLTVLTVYCTLTTTALYLYPLLLSCSYPNPMAPFRLLTLADPQLEGNTSIYSSRYKNSPAWLRVLRRLRKTLDLWGNDLYLAHIFKSLHSTVPDLTAKFPFLPQGLTHPTHVVVLGDLIGSQWISDVEFSHRGDRFWNTVFSRAKKLPERALNDKNRIPGSIYDLIDWRNTLINVVGNHDIGYGGDIRPDLIARFDQTYGPVNYAFTIPFPAVKNSKTGETITPKLRVVNLNSLNIDSPVREYDIQMQTYTFMNSVFGEQNPWDGSVGTVLLTHVPLHKEEGTCVDGPMTNYYEPMYGSLIKEQNHISKGASDMLLGELFGTRRVGEDRIPKDKEMGIILDGHDHEGCDVVHYLTDVEFQDEKGEGTGRGWKASKWGQKQEAVKENSLWVREVTVRSMMGEFGGNAGLTSAWFDTDAMSWRFEYSTCPVGIQHIWWTVHITDIIVALLVVSYGIVISLAKFMDKADSGVEKRSLNGQPIPTVVITEPNGHANGESNGEAKTQAKEKTLEEKKEQ